MFISVSYTHLDVYKRQVNGDISDVKTDLALMRLRTERLQSYNQPEDVAKVGNALNELYIEIEETLDEITALYLGPTEDTAALRFSFCLLYTSRCV